ncbi:MAG: DNA topoisomerase, partial [Planctomycetota bacterium]
MGEQDKDVVIVESPAKAKAISKYLGEEYGVEASKGHVRDLPPDDFGVDVEDGFEPTYRTLPDSRGTVGELREKVENADTVYLAPDPDREGEAIAWHLQHALRLPEDRVRRVTFNEVTKNAVREAFKHPGDINMNLVNAQQARRILDRIVGYELSPLISKKVVRGLSAGRVQSVALRLICEREKEIEAFEPEEYWKIEAELSPGEDASFRAWLKKWKDEKPDLSNEEEAQAVCDALQESEFVVSEGEQKKSRSKPP